MNGGVSRSRPVVGTVGEREPAGGVEDVLDERGDQRGLGGGVVVGADHIQGAAGPDERVGVEAGLFGVGEGAVGEVGVGEAADGVAEGLPDPGPGLLDHGLGLLQGAADGGEARGGRGGCRRLRCRCRSGTSHELRDGRAGQGGGEQVGGEDVDGAAFEERDGSRRRRCAVAGGGADAGPGRGVSPPSPWCSPGSGDQRTRSRPGGGAGQVEQVHGGSGPFPGGGGEQEQVELGGGDQQPGRGRARTLWIRSVSVLPDCCGAITPVAFSNGSHRSCPVTGAWCSGMPTCPSAARARPRRVRSGRVTLARRRHAVGDSSRAMSARVANPVPVGAVSR